MFGCGIKLYPNNNNNLNDDGPRPTTNDDHDDDGRTIGSRLTLGVYWIQDIYGISDN